MLPEPGTYIAAPLGWGMVVDDGKTPQFLMQFECRYVMRGGAWEPAQNEQITGYFYPLKKNGDINEICVDQLQKSLGWDGASFASLENGDWREVEVQIVIEDEVYDGKSRRKVKYLNPRDYRGPSVEKADPQTIRNLDQRYGAALRATTKAKPSPATRPATDPTDAAKREAWEKFKAGRTGMEQDELVADWRGALKDYFGDGVDFNKLTPSQWKAFMQDGFARRSPVSDEAQFKGSDIPF
jgi:hypothetical protein